MKVSIMKVQILKMLQTMKMMKDMTVNACKTQLIQHLIMILNLMIIIHLTELIVKVFQIIIMEKKLVEIHGKMEKITIIWENLNLNFGGIFY